MKTPIKIDRYHTPTAEFRVNNRLETVLHAIDTNALDPLRQIRCVVEDDTLADAMKLERIGTILDQRHEDAIDRLQKKIRESSSDDMQYRKILEVKSQRLQNRINSILRQIAFTGDGRTVGLLAALAYFREKDGKLDSKMPLGFLTPDERKAVLNTSGGFRISLCKVYLFQHVVGAVKSGNPNLDGSYKYRWEKEKTELLARAGLSEFADPRSVLNTLNKDLHQEYLRTNQAAANGSNPYLKIWARRLPCEDTRSGRCGNGPHAKHHAKTIDPVVRGSGECSPTLRDAR